MCEDAWRCVKMCEDMWRCVLRLIFVFVASVMLACVCPWASCEEILKCTTFAEIILQRLGQLGVAQACFCLPVHDVLVRCLVRDGRRSWHSLEPMSFSSTSQCHICTVNDIWGHKMSDVLWIMYDSVWLYGMIRHAAWWPVIVFWSILCIFVSWWSLYIIIS
jgi:hypothetical protein